MKIIEEAGFVETKTKQRLPRELIFHDWHGGEAVRNIVPDDLTFICARKPPDYFGHAAMYVVSGKLMSAFDNHSAHAEYIKVFVEFGNRRVDDYFLVNFLDVVDCIDMQNSIFSDDGPFPRMLRRLAIIIEKTNGISAFRIHRFPLVGISDALATEIQDLKCTGMEILSPTDWRNPIFEKKV